MTIVRTVLAGAALVLATLGFAPLAAAADCGRERFAEADFIVCTIDPATEDLRLFWRDESGAPYRHYSALADGVEASGERLVLALNAGMYDGDYAPIGFYVEDGREFREVNLASVEGPPARVPNFYKKPNGVFFLKDGMAGILETELFVSREVLVDFATQSGPMLVIEGALHPALIPGSSDRTRRSGVGVCENGAVRLAISEGNVNFHDFARLFRDHLGCANALFLDGGRGAGLYHPPLRRNDFSWHGGYGPMLGVVE